MAFRNRATAGEVILAVAPRFGSAKSSGKEGLISRFGGGATSLAEFSRENRRDGYNFKTRFVLTAVGRDVIS